MADSVKYPEDVAATFFKREEERRNWFNSKVAHAGYPIGHKMAPLSMMERSSLKSLVETMLFASMAMEEGHIQPVGVVFAERREDFKKSRWELVTIREPPRLAVAEVTKLAAICEFPHSCLAVMPAGEELKVVGVATPVGRSLFRPDNLVRVMAPSPGVVVVGIGTREFVRYVRGSIPAQSPFYLQYRKGQEQRQLVSIAYAIGARASQSEAPRVRAIKAIRRELLVFTEFFRVVSKMSQLGHGGILAILGPNEDAQELLLKARVLDSPMEYGAAVLDQEQAEMDWMEREDWERINSGASVERLERMRQQLVRFTAVDGAVLLSHSLHVLGFGVKLTVSGKPPEVVEVNSDGTPGIRWPLESRGARHRAAANFAAEHPEGLVFIVSQDGDAAVFQSVGGQVVYWPLGVPVGDLVAG